MALQQIVEQTVVGLGYELVEIERSAGGLLRVTIDLPWPPQSASSAEFKADRRVTVEDCEQVTRQLQFALEVEAVEYRRLEVSSPGIDRVLRGERDFERFAGSVVDITLKVSVGAAARGLVSANRKKFRGKLERCAGVVEAPSRWQIVWSDAPVSKPGLKVSRKRPAEPLQVLGFSLEEVREARLAPIVDFKGRAGKPSAEPRDD